MRLFKLLSACVAIAALPMSFPAASQSLAPHLLLTQRDFDARKDLAAHEPWAHHALEQILQQADGFPEDYLKRWGLTRLEVPPKGGQWYHWYVCPQTGAELEFHPPDHNICPDTGKDYQDWPISDVHYMFMNDQLANDAVALGVAFRFTGKPLYAQQAAEILKLYADRYNSYPIHDNNGGQSRTGARVYSQTLDESIWLIQLTFAYDLVRDSAALNADSRSHIENDLLRPAAAVCVRGHKEPTLNIQSWINGAEAAVGFELRDKALIDEAIDGPLGFRHQMKNYVHEGFWLEGSWGYQFYAMRPLSYTAEMARQNGLDLWKQEPALAGMFVAPLGVLLPNGNLPAFNDTHEVSLYPNAPLYEMAYGNTRDPRLLTVLDHSDRSSKEALLFGASSLPPAPPPSRESEAFPEAGYAALRAPHDDFTLIMKFGPHGGGHGHYDELGFVSYADGLVQAVDPGTQLYGMALHKEWDQTSIAHNTITADELQQAAATGKLLAFRKGDDFAAATADAGAVYPFAQLTRSILLTDDYAIELDHAHATDGKPHDFDVSYHNFGSQTLSLATAPYSGFPQKPGYMHLENAQRGETGNDIHTRFDNEGTAVALEILGGTPTEVLTGVAPGPHPTVKVPFLITRRHAADATFITLTVPSKGTVPNITASANGNTITVQSPRYTDTITLGVDIGFHRTAR